MLAHLPSKANRPALPVAVNADTELPGSSDVVLRFDGSCNPNPGPMGVGYVLLTPESRVLVRVGAPVGRGTNNEAEYQALLAGLRHALKLGFWNLRIQSDSKLVVEQLRGAWKVKDKLAVLHREASNLLGLFKDWELHHIFREQNTGADELSRKMVFEEPQLPPLPGAKTSRYPKSLYEWQAAAIRIWWLTKHPGSGTLSRIFGIAPAAIEQIGYGKSYREADFSDYQTAQLHIRRGLDILPDIPGMRPFTPEELGLP